MSDEDYGQTIPDPGTGSGIPLDHPLYQKEMAALAANQQATMGIAAGGEHRPTITELLVFRKSSLERELELINAALAKAKENQGAMDLMDAVAKTRVHG